MESHPRDTLGTRFLTFWGAIGAFFGFAVFAILLQKCSSDGSSDPRDLVRAANLVEVRGAGLAELEKLGWSGEDAEAVTNAVTLVSGRKQSETKVVVPGSETAAKQAAEATANTGSDGGGEAGEGDAPPETNSGSSPEENDGDSETNDEPVPPEGENSGGATEAPSSGSSDTTDKTDSSER